MPSYEKTSAELVEEGKWRHVYTSEPLDYLPGYDEESRLNERAKVYVYRTEA